MEQTLYTPYENPDWKFNGFLYRLLVRDLKKEFPDNFRNTKKYFILIGNTTNIILFKEVKTQVEAVFASDYKVIKRRTYRTPRGYKKILKRIIRDYKTWNR